MRSQGPSRAEQGSPQGETQWGESEPDQVGGSTKTGRYTSVIRVHVGGRGLTPSAGGKVVRAHTRGGGHSQGERLGMGVQHPSRVRRTSMGAGG